MDKALALLTTLLLVVAQQILAPIRSGHPVGGTPITVVEYVCGSHLGAGGCATSGASSVTLTFGVNTLAGEAIIAISQGNPTGTGYGSVTDSGSEAYNQDPTLQKTGIGAHQAVTLWYLCNVSAGISSFTWTYGSGDGNNSQIILAHVRGLNTSSTTACRDSSKNFPASASNTPFSSTSDTPTASKKMLIMGPVTTAFGTATTVSATAPWTLEKSTNNGGSNNFSWFDQIVSSTSGSYSVSGTGTSGTAIYFPAIAAFTQ
jgi:hypothetical protein